MPHAYHFGKNLQKSGTDVTERNGRNGQADFEHSNVKGASAKMLDLNFFSYGYAANPGLAFVNTPSV